MFHSYQGYKVHIQLYPVKETSKAVLSFESLTREEIPQTSCGCWQAFISSILLNFKAKGSFQLIGSSQPYFLSIWDCFIQTRKEENYLKSRGDICATQCPCIIQKQGCLRGKSSNSVNSRGEDYQVEGLSRSWIDLEHF